MSLFGKNLRLGAAGEDVGALQRLLERVGHPVPMDEFHDQVFKDGTHSAVAEFQRRSHLPPTGVVDDATVTALLRAAGEPADPPERPGEPVPGQQVVRGQVMFRRGLAVVGVHVLALHRELRRDHVLGAAITDERGEFSITYDTSNVAGGLVDLQVRAFADAHAAQRGSARDSLGQSRIFYSAGPLEKVRLRLVGGPETRWTQYQQAVAEISPFLGDLQIADLTEDVGVHDLSLLAGKTNQPLRNLADLVLAHRLARQTSLQPDTMYGLVRRGLATSLGALASQDEARLQVVLQSAADTELVPITATQDAAQVLAGVRAAAVSALAESADQLGGVLHSVESAQVRAGFVEKLIEVGTGPQEGPEGPATQLWDAVAADPQLAGAVPQLQLNVQLAALTGEHAPAVAALAGVLDAQGPGVRELARYSVADFEEVLRGLPAQQRVPAEVVQAVAGTLPADATEEEVAAAQTTAYATLLQGIVAQSMPTEVLAANLAQDEAVPQPTRTFWRNVASAQSPFDLRAGLDPQRLDPALLAGIAEDDRPAVLEQVATAKRLFNITTDPGHMKVLSAAGLDSAQAIARIGASTFIARYSESLGGPQTALRYASRAIGVSATAAAVYSGFAPALNEAPMYVLPDYDFSARPDLATLFGPLELCECSACQTILSPAAYLAELLAWLADRATPDGGTARDVLLRRRPDIGEVELTCANTNTVLPYIDLVIEALENLVSPRPQLVLADVVAADLDLGRIPEPVTAAFAGAGVPLDPAQECYVVTPGQHWFLTDHRELWVLRRDPGAAGTITARFGSYQSAASAQQLAAEPEHRNPAAYLPLRAARHPVGAPLDLWTEEVRTYLGHLLAEPATAGQHRAGLMAAVAPITVDPNADFDITCESLGMTVAARDALLAPAAQPWLDFGLQEVGNPVAVFDPVAGSVGTQLLGWQPALGHVVVVLRALDLQYTDLVELLGARTVNPALGIRIASADDTDLATCELEKLLVLGMDAAAASRLRRFVRLRAHLGWTTAQLDELITALHGSLPVDDRIDEGLLVALAAVDRLHRRLGVDLVELAALWAPLRADTPDAQYFALFQDPQVVRPLDPAFAVEQVGGVPQIVVAPGDPQPLISEHRDPISSALGLPAADLDALAGELTDGELTIANLTTLYRYSLLARSLRLGARELLALRECAADPFPAGPAGPPATLRFVDLVADVRAIGLPISEIDYLLFHQGSVGGQPLLPDTQVAAALGQLRASQREVIADTELGDSPAEDLRRWLGQLGWATSVVDDLLAVLDGTATSSVALAAAPPGLVVPAALQDRVSVGGGWLGVRGALTDVERDLLLAASAEPAFQAAVTAAHSAPRLTVSRYLNNWEVPTVTVALAAMPVGVTIPAELAGRVYFNATSAQLALRGPVTGAESQRLRALAPDPDWQAGVAALEAASQAHVPGQALLADSAGLLNLQVPQRMLAFAELVGARVRTARARQAALSWLGGSLGVGQGVLGALLDGLAALGSPAEPAVSDFLVPVLAGSHPDTAITAAGYPIVFAAYTRLFKLARLVTGLGWTAAELGWLAKLAPGVPDRPIPWLPGQSAGWWQPASMLTEQQNPARSAAPLAQLLRVVTLVRCARRLQPGAMAELVELAAGGAATLSDCSSRLAAATSGGGMEVRAADVAALAAQRGLAVPDFADETAVAALLPSVELLRRTGATAQQLIGFARAEADQHAARAARQLVRSNYDDQQWERVAKPLRDRLRSTTRDALVAHLLANPATPELGTESGLYRHLLLDSGTEPVVLTSRIKQAISSVQLFVQSAMMNLVPGVVVDAAADPGWREWEWLKSYRVWEANRRVFCTPENWLEPSLRDDRTPLFTQLESALMRDDVTADVVTDAFADYLTGLDEIARLEILGLYEVPATPGQPVTLYVVGRSRGRTPNYFWRTRVDGAQWTPWRRIDVDIAEPQVLPVLWNGRLHLFWPVFIDVTPQQPPGDKPAYPATRHYDIALAYTSFHRGKWQPKALTELTVSTPLVPVDDQPDTVKCKLVLRASVGSPDLWVWPEWDNPDANIATVKPGYTPTNPGVKGVFAAVKGFHFTGRDHQVQTYGQEIGGIFEPTGTVPEGMLFAQKGNSRLHLPATLDWRTEGMVLARVPSRFTLAYPHQDQFISGARTFVYQDGQRSYIVDPAVGVEIDWDFATKPKVWPGVIGKMKEKYYSQVAAVLAAGAPKVAPADPVGQYGTSDPLRVAQRVALAAQALPAPAPGVAHLARQVGDSRQFIVKADKAVIGVAQYLKPERIHADLMPALVRKQVRRYVFRPAFHPYVGSFQDDFAVGGVTRLVSRESQYRSATPFAALYQPQALVGTPYPVEEIDFDPAGFHGQYHWELFFHAPVLIAKQLRDHQRFEEAQKWFHLVFDPTDTSAGPVPARFWRTKPLHELSQPGSAVARLADIVGGLAAGTADPGLLRQVAQWRADPFNPYAVARLRLSAFQKMVVMAYLDNLIAWGDQLFGQDTIESINYATNLYLLAAEILGPRPDVVPARARPQVRTPVSLDPQVEMLSNALVNIEAAVGTGAPDSVLIDPDTPAMSWPKLAYFAVPRNDKLYGYWDTVADRLFKIRNSLNIAGLSRQLPLFEPPIDPALLVRARAAGLDVAAVLAEVSAPPPNYRFRVLAGQAAALANDLRALGGALLAAMEKRDAEALALLRATGEAELADAVEAIKDKAVAEGQAQVASLRAQRAQAVGRYQHYQRMLGITGAAVPPEDRPITPLTASANTTIAHVEGVKLLNHEKSELDSLRDSRDSQTAAAIAQGAGSTLAVVPTISFDGKPWGVGGGTAWGGQNMAAAAGAVAAVFSANAASSSFDAAKSARLAQAVMRENDWVLAVNQAAAEIMATDRARLAAEIRLAAAVADLENHQQFMRQSHQVRDFMAEKYTNAELYDWMAAQVGATFFQGYQLAHDMAKRAERAMARELGLASVSHIQFGYWDSTRKGLLAGERLSAAIARMQADYLERNRRSYEITKHISLASINPMALVELRERGVATFHLPEAIFDLDRPGDFARRIKLVSLSLPCVTGPYTSVNAKLTLLSSQVRTAATPAVPYPQSDPDDPRFTSVTSLESVVTSSGRDDTGMFRPELDDERFLPFEGAGVVGTWHLELPTAYRQFDYQSISDAVLTLRYTARDGGAQLRDAALAKLAESLEQMEVGVGQAGMFRLLSAREDYPDQWYRLGAPPQDPLAPPTLAVAIGAQRFPFAYHDRALSVQRVAVVLRPKVAYEQGEAFTVELVPPGRPAMSQVVRVIQTELGGLPAAVFDLGGDEVAVRDDKPWQVRLTALPGALGEQIQVEGVPVTRLRRDCLADLGLLLEYRLQP